MTNNTLPLINTYHFHSDDTQNIRVIFINNEPWFVAKDVAAALEYPAASLEQPSNLFKAVPEEWTDHNRIKVRSANGVEQMRDMLFISEQGLYFFLGRSDKPKALSFQKWYAGEVIPSIRKTGSYTMPNAMPAIPNKDPDEIPLNLSYVKQMDMLAKKYRMQPHDVLVLENIRTKSRKQGYGIACSNFEKEFKGELARLGFKTDDLSDNLFSLNARLTKIEEKNKVTNVSS